jgi:NAD(P)-dependent dehydrogenase (short-subunit alcohol dehydrogenase family)
MTEAFDFTGKVVFVAGGSSGINLGIAEAFAAHGANVAIASRSQEKIDAAIRQLAGHGNRVLGFAADVREPAAIAKSLQQTAEEFGAIDILISGAAGNFAAPALGMSANAFKTVIDIDLIGSFNVFRAAHQFLRKPGASVISISAPQALNPTPFQAHVCAAKTGIDMLLKVLAMEWGPDGIRLNSVIPGPIDDTEGMRRLAPTKEAREAFTNKVPLGRFGTKQEVANIAMFLASPLASYVTGAVISVDGGISLTGPRDLRMAASAV